ncbi:MAG: carbohydrate ABC transporter permease, partial [Anaerorhabdus sp.]
MAKNKGLFHSKKVGLRAVRSLGGDMFNIIILLVVGFVMIIPLVFMVSNAFKPLDELMKFPPDILVRNPTIDNFLDLSLLMSESWVPFT